MPVLTELVRDFNYEKNLINDGGEASTSSTEWTSIKEYANQIVIQSGEQVLAFSITLDVPTGGAVVKVDVDGKTVWFKAYSSGGTDIKENFIAYVPAGTYTLQIRGKVKAGGETLTVKSVKVGVARLMDASKDSYEYTDVEISDGASSTVVNRSLNLPAKRTTPLGKAAKTVLRIQAYIDNVKYSASGGDEAFGIAYARSIYGGNVHGNVIHSDAPCAGRKITKARFRLRRYGSAMGSVYCYVRRADTNELLGCLGSVEASSIPDTGYVWVDFDGGDDIQLPEGAAVRIYLKYPDGDDSNYINVGYYGSQTVSWLHRCWSSDESSWSEDTSTNYRMRIWWVDQATDPVALKNPGEADESGKLNVRLKLGGSEVGWNTRNNGEGIGWAEKEAVIDLSDEASAISAEISVTNQCGGTRWVSGGFRVYGSPWILPSTLTDVIELGVPQNATIYVITEPLEGDPTKTVGIGYLKAIPYTEELYAYATGTGILEFHYTFDILKPVANMLKWRGKGASASILAADIRG